MHGVGIDQTLWIRREALHERSGSRHGRYTWLEPPNFSATPTIAEVVSEPTPTARTATLGNYLEAVYRAWAAAHGTTIAKWYAQFIAAAGRS
jgi:hypothetical protein